MGGDVEPYNYERFEKLLQCGKEVKLKALL